MKFPKIKIPGILTTTVIVGLVFLAATPLYEPYAPIGGILIIASGFAYAFWKL